MRLVRLGLTNIIVISFCAMRLMKQVSSKLQASNPLSRMSVQLHNFAIASAEHPAMHASLVYAAVTWLFLFALYRFTEYLLSGKRFIYFCLLHGGSLGDRPIKFNIELMKVFEGSSSRFTSLLRITCV